MQVPLSCSLVVMLNKLVNPLDTKANKNIKTTLKLNIISLYIMRLQVKKVKVKVDFYIGLPPLTWTWPAVVYNGKWRTDQQWHRWRSASSSSPLRQVIHSPIFCNLRLNVTLQNVSPKVILLTHIILENSSTFEFLPQTPLRFPPVTPLAVLSTPAISTHVTLCHIVHSCFLPVSLGAALVTPAFSTRVTSCRVVHSRVVHYRVRVLCSPPLAHHIGLGL